jgi:hypothetical protein
VSSEDVAQTNATVSVKTYLGTTGANVKTYAAAVPVPVWLTRKQQFVRDANGNQVTSQSTVSAVIAYADTFAPQSKVTITGERETTVISRAVSTGGDLIEGLDRVKAFLQ